MKKRPLAVLAAIAAIAVLVASTERAAHACAGCSNPNLLQARGGANAIAPGMLGIGLNLTGTVMRVVHPEHCPDIGPICNQRAEPPQQHDQAIYSSEIRPIVTLGISRLFSAELQAPIRLVHTTITYRRLDGTAFTPDYTPIHHRTETLSGPGDWWLLGRMRATIGPLYVATRAGFSIPFGSTEPDPFALGRAGLPHQHIQFGTGTVYPVLAIDAGANVRRARVAAYVQTLLFLYENGHGYLPGNRYSVGWTADYELFRNFRLGAGMDLLNEQPERWARLVQQDGNVGRTDLLAGGMVSYGFGTSLVSLQVRSPIWQHFISNEHGDPGQLTYPAIVSASFQTAIDP